MISDPARLEREVRAHNRLRELLLRFSQGVATTFSLTVALEELTPGILELLEARTVEIWLHDRRSRQLTLSASAGGGAPGTQIAADDGSHYAAEGLRLERPALRRGYVVAPLRGWRRALGTLAIVSDGPHDEGVLDFTYELARQMSVAIENVRLLEDVMRQRRLLEDTFNSLVDLVAVMDNDMRVVQTNAAFATRAGLTGSEVVGRSLDELVGSATFAYARTADPHDIVPAQHRVEDDKLKGTFLLTATPLSSQDGQNVGRVLVARDITRQTRLESERAALRERLAQSEKLASLGQFVAGIAHEMNNPLQGVLGHLELLIDMTPEARPVRKPLKQVYNEADRAAKIVHNLLVFTGSHRMQRKSIQVDRILTRALSSRGVHLRRSGIVITRKKGERLPPISVDHLLMQQALLNILINAEHATREAGGSQIDVETATTAEGAVTVTIRDSGVGIADDVLARIFDPFFTTKEVGKGTGLGLAITYGIINEHGGSITAATDPKGGAVFRIELPAANTAVVK